VLTERGLGPAIEALAERAVVPVHCQVRLDRRLPERVEAAAYFTVAEGITNIGKYANATRAEVSVQLEGDELFVHISDDGVGGAELSRGTGLRGLEDRLSAVGGSLILDSPKGGGTRLIAAIPAGEAAFAEDDEEVA
jgi:signal transduction histidine kinase